MKVYTAEVTKSFEIEGLKVRKGDTLKFSAIPMQGRGKSGKVFIFTTDDDKQFVLTPQRAGEVVKSVDNFEIKSRMSGETRQRLKLTMHKYCLLRLQGRGEDPKEKCSCPRCSGTGMWAHGTRHEGKCFLCSGAGTCTNLQAEMHWQKRFEREEQNIPMSGSMG